MTTSKTVVMVGVYEVFITEKLREDFAKVHESMSGSRAIEEQFSHDEQYALLLCCRTALGKEPSAAALKDREDDLCELMHYLALNGVAVVDMIGQLRTYSARTRSVAMQLRYMQQQATEKAEREELEQEYQRRTSEMRFIPAPVSKTREAVVA